MTRRKRQIGVLLLLVAIAVVVSAQNLDAPRFDPSGPALSVNGIRIGDTQSEVLTREPSPRISLDRPNELEFDPENSGLRLIHISNEDRVSLIHGTQLEQGDVVLVRVGDTEESVLSALGPPEPSIPFGTEPRFKVFNYTVPDHLEILILEGRVVSEESSKGIVSGGIRLRASD